MIDSVSFNYMRKVKTHYMKKDSERRRNTLNEVTENYKLN